MFLFSKLRAVWWVELTMRWRTPAGRLYWTASREATRPAAGSWAEWPALEPACLYCWCAGRQSRPAESAAHCRWNTGQDTQQASQTPHTLTHADLICGHECKALEHTLESCASTHWPQGKDTVWSWNRVWRLRCDYTVSRRSQRCSSRVLHTRSDGLSHR